MARLFFFGIELQDKTQKPPASPRGPGPGEGGRYKNNSVRYMKDARR